MNNSFKMIVIRQHKTNDIVNFELFKKLYNNFCYIALWSYPLVKI